MDPEFLSTWAIRMQVPAGQDVRGAAIALVRKTNVKGRVRAAVYGTPENEAGDAQLLPLGVSYGVTLNTEGAGWTYMDFPRTLPARSSEWTAWLMVEFTDPMAVQIPAVQPYVWDERYGSGDVYSSVLGTKVALPPYLDFAGMKLDHRVPLVALG
ncbi:hypothetical protein [Nonomuraea sp. SYSU D8015]|uniref:hypothetical protein n=1 Tax=Nonomuraea sp. SYSU D8015 TaxID=2593644 RepID=UPI001660FB4C|nr:hypothetical protein [Nonomuraea sp. SYSU D8015]